MEIYKICKIDLKYANMSTFRLISSDDRIFRVKLDILGMQHIILKVRNWELNNFLPQGRFAIALNNILNQNSSI